MSPLATTITFRRLHFISITSNTILDCILVSEQDEASLLGFCQTLIVFALLGQSTYDYDMDRRTVPKRQYAERWRVDLITLVF